MLPLGHVIPRALAELLRGTPLSPGKVDFAWKAAVGPALERVTNVHLERHILIVEASSPHWAREVSRSTGVLLKRMQALLGPDAVQEIIVRA